MLMEFLAHRILKRARRRSPIPIVLNGTIVGSGATGRECASLDVSYAGDPLDVRHLRVAFGAYQKHRFQPHLNAEQGVGDRPPFVAVPRGRASLEYLLSEGRDLRHAARAARVQSAALPDVSEGVAHTIDAYLTSPLARFHKDFYSAPPASMTLDALVGSSRWLRLPECVRSPLIAPNDRLLQPAVIQHVTRVLMAEGLSPREIAALVQSRYTADFNWGRRWQLLEPQSRAEFDVRTFAGLVVTGLDQGVDFNCRSAQEKGLCPGHPCLLDLRNSHRQLRDLMSL